MARIAIDAGHGSETAGKRTPDGYREHWANVAVANKLYNYLLQDGHTLFRTGWNDANAKDDSDVSLATRQNQIKAFGADISVSIHFNAFGDGKTYNSANGIETLIHNNSNYINDSEKLANLIQNELIKGTQQTNRKVKRQALAMCNCVKMGTKASVLCELGFMTNAREADLMDDETFLEECANEIRTGINLYFGVTNSVIENKDDIKHTNYTHEEFIDYVGKIAVEDYKNHKILPSITIAQAIKESGLGKSELAQNANALFGIKKNGWNGEVYHKVATEQLPDGTYVTTQDKVEWRKYDSWRDSIIDHGEYLCTRKVGNQKEPNWKNLIGETNLDKALDYLQGAQYKYATSLTYRDSLKNDYILKYGLTKYDDMIIQNTTTTIPNAPELSQTTNTIPNTPFTIKVLINDLNYRSEPKMGNNIKGTTKKGIFTIVEVKNGWGKLKSGVGWVYLENPNYLSIINEPKEYVVSGGDTLIKIGQKTGVDWKTIASINGIKSPWRIYIGQVLRLE